MQLAGRLLASQLLLAVHHWKALATLFTPVAFVILDFVLNYNTLKVNRIHTSLYTIGIEYHDYTPFDLHVSI